MGICDAGDPWFIGISGVAEKISVFRFRSRYNITKLLISAYPSWMRLVVKQINKV